MSHSQIAAKFGVKENTISQIIFAYKHGKLYFDCSFEQKIELYNKKMTDKMDFKR